MFFSPEKNKETVYNNQSVHVRLPSLLLLLLLQLLLLLSYTFDYVDKTTKTHNIKNLLLIQ